MLLPSCSQPDSIDRCKAWIALHTVDYQTKAELASDYIYYVSHIEPVDSSLALAGDYSNDDESQEAKWSEIGLYYIIAERFLA